MAGSKNNRNKAVTADLDNPAYAELLTHIVDNCHAFDAVGLIDTQREQGVLKPGNAEQAKDAVALAKDLLDRGNGQARQALLGLGNTDFAALQVDDYWLLVVPFAPERVVLVCIDCHGRLEMLPRHAQKIEQKLQKQEMAEALQNHSNVQRGWMLDLKQSAVTAEFKRRGSEQRVALQVIDELHPLEQLLAATRALLDSGVEQPRLDWLQGVMLTVGGRTQLWQRLEFVPDCVVWAQSDGDGWTTQATEAMRSLHNDVLRQLIAELLASGMETMIEPFPQTDMEFNAIVEELRNLEGADLIQRLVIGGFANHPIGEGEDRMRCMECIYFLPHRRWCDLPELPVPVEADWFCRLWKV